MTSCTGILFLIVVSAILLVGSISFSSITAIAASATGKTTITPIKHLVFNLFFKKMFPSTITSLLILMLRIYPANLNFYPYLTHLSNTIGLLNNNTNLANPWRLGKSQVVTVASCDPNHSYTALQKEIDGGLMDKYVQNSALSIQHCDPKLVMGHFDGNTVTALSNYAQHFAMSDNFH